MATQVNKFLHKIKRFFPTSQRQTTYDKLVSLLRMAHLEEVASAKDDDQKTTVETKLEHEASMLIHRLQELGISKSDRDFIIGKIQDIKEIEDIIKLLPRAGALNLQHFNYKTILLAVERGWEVSILFDIAQKFQQHNLDEDPDYADFDKLINSGISDKDAQEIVNVLIQAKYKGLDITQEDILKYLNSLQKNTEEPIKNLYMALLVIKEKNLDLRLNDLLVGTAFGRPPKQLAITYARIRDNELAIDKAQYLSLTLKQSTIDKIINFMVVGKKHNLIIDFDDIVKQYYLGNNVFDVLRILMKLLENGFEEIDFGYLTKLALLKADLNTVVPAFFYARNKLNIKEFQRDIERVLPIVKTNSENEQNEDEGPGFNLVNFAKALDLGINEFGIDKETLITDFTSGIDVWGIIDLMNYSKKNGVEVNYIVAKILASQGLDNLKEIIYKSLNPFEIESPYINVTTKDNIEIKVKLIIMVTYNINNLFKGTDEEFLLRRVKAIFIDEIQKNYNHDEIVRNIEIIGRNVLLRLKGQSPISEGSNRTDIVDKDIIKEPEQEAQFMKVSKYNPVKILIPQIEFVKDTFKEIEKLKHEYEAEKEKLNLEIAKIRAEVKIKEAWAKSKDLKYLILRDEESEKNSGHHGHGTEEEEDEH